jgi:hypothetical protein
MTTPETVSVFPASVDHAGAMAPIMAASTLKELKATASQ